MFEALAKGIFPDPVFVMIILLLLFAVGLFMFRGSMPVAVMLGIFVLYSFITVGFGNQIWQPLFYVVIGLGGGLIVYSILKIARKG